MKYSSPAVASESDCEKNCVPKCEKGWEEEGGKCYFFSEDEWTWVRAEEDCKRDHGWHLASVTDKQTNDFIAKHLTASYPFWIGARQTFESDKASWAWADGCSHWNYTSWARPGWPKNYNADGVAEQECAFLEKPAGTGYGARWVAVKCDDPKRKFKFVCSTPICPNEPINLVTGETLKPSF